MQEEERKIRRLSDLSLIDDYLFRLFIQEAGSEEILKGLVERMLSVKISHIHLKQSQHEITSEPTLRGLCMDAYLEVDKNTLYNIEVQIVNRGDIPKRMRFYQAMIDKESMPSGEYKYSILPKTIIIFVNDFDLFGKGLYRYTFENVCLEDKSILLNDESIKVILNTRGTDSRGVDQELVELLQYFRKSTRETVDKISSEFIKEVDSMLEPIKNNPKFGTAYWVEEEKRYLDREEGEEKATEKIIKKMRKVGMTDKQIEEILLADI